MNPKLIRLIIALMFMAMTGLIGIQLYWIRQAIEQREMQFEQSVYEAMANAVYDYEKKRIEKEMSQLFNWKTMEEKMQMQLDSLGKKKSKKKNKDVVINVNRPGIGKGQIWFNQGDATIEQPRTLIDPYDVDGAEQFDYILPEIGD
ncbi:MAG: hypothetical protein H3C71_06250, partial [Flavobacteriales bacterium]|nr:hypothetical protein [Flavobacteriales bacterium]